MEPAPTKEYVMILQDLVLVMKDSVAFLVKVINLCFISIKFDHSEPIFIIVCQETAVTLVTIWKRGNSKQIISSSLVT